MGATVWDVSGPTPTEAVKPPPPNVLGEVRLHTRMRKKNIDMKKQRRRSIGRLRDSLLTCIKSTIRKWMETISSNWG